MPWAFRMMLLAWLASVDVYAETYVEGAGQVQSAVADGMAQNAGEIKRLTDIINDPKTPPKEREAAIRERQRKMATQGELQRQMQGAQNAEQKAQQGGGGKGGGGGKKEEKSPTMPPPPPPPPEQKKDEPKKPESSPMPTVSIAPLPSSSPQADKPIENSADKDKGKLNMDAEKETTKKISELREQKLQDQLADLNAVTEAKKKEVAAKTQAARTSLNVAGTAGVPPAPEKAPKKTVAEKIGGFANKPVAHAAPKTKPATGHRSTIPVAGHAFAASLSAPVDRLFESAKPSLVEEEKEVDPLASLLKKKKPKAPVAVAAKISPARGVASVTAAEGIANRAAEEATLRYLRENARLVVGSFPPKKTEE